jgi:hypothetical protein
MREAPATPAKPSSRHSRTLHSNGRLPETTGGNSLHTVESFPAASRFLQRFAQLLLTTSYCDFVRWLR